jgi:hypothetical protein
LKTRSFQAMRIWATVVDRSRIRRFSGGREKGRKRKWEEQRTRTFSREVTTMTTVAKLQILSRISHVFPTRTLQMFPRRSFLRLIALPRESKRYGEQHLFELALTLFLFPQTLLPRSHLSRTATSWASVDLAAHIAVARKETRHVSWWSWG